MTENASTQLNGDHDLVIWPDPSPLSSWWDLVMRDSHTPHTKFSIKKTTTGVPRIAPPRENLPGDSASNAGPETNQVPRPNEACPPAA